MVDYIFNSYKYYADVEILGFTTKNRNQLIKSHFSENITSGEVLLRHLDTTPALSRLAEIPIISQMVCIIWKNQESLPHNMTALYAKFAEVLIRRRVADQQHWQQQMNSTLSGLGQVALNGILDLNGKRLLFDRDEFSECNRCLEYGSEFGFLQRENFTSGLDVKEVVTFYHVSFQEYFAAHYLIHLLQNNKNNFISKLKLIDNQNVFEMETLLRFTCGQSVKAASLILEHVQNLNRKGTEGMLRVLLFESGSMKLVRKLKALDYIFCFDWQDLLSLNFYLKALTSSNVSITIHSIHLFFISYDDMDFVRDILSSVDSRSIEIVTIYFDDLKSRHSGESFNEPKDPRWIQIIRGRSIFNLEEMLRGLTRMLRNQSEFLYLRMTQHLSIDLHAKITALHGPSIADYLMIDNIDMHGRLGDLAPLIRPSLVGMSCQECGLVEDDVMDLEVNLLTSDRLRFLDISGNHISPLKMTRLAEFLYMTYPAPFMFVQDVIALDRDFFQRLSNLCISTKNVRCIQNVKLLT
jgi:hypothetical protein